MAINISSPFLGLKYSLSSEGETAQLNVHSHTGDILPALVKIEMVLAEQGHKVISLKFTSSKYQQINRLSRLNYENKGDYFHKDITYKKEVRFSITEKCNYHCFFCHEEGMEMEVKREKGSYESFFSMIDQLAELKYNDFTFTGGEPLLNWKGIEACLNYMEEINYLPEITIVTNGERINDRILSRLKLYPGFIRFNLSLHSLLDDEYLHIVHRKKKPEKGSLDLLSKIKEKMALISAYEIPFKLNIVLLKDINTSAKSLNAILEYAQTCGAISVKFLELLITEDLKRFYPYFYSLSAVHEDIKDDLTLLWKNQKKDVYQYKNSDLEVELQHCPCARGCNSCLLNRGVTFTAEMKYFPCFLHPENSLNLTKNNLANCIEKGTSYIDSMAENYQDNSPILIRDRYATNQESAYYYEISSDDKDKISNILSGNLIRIRGFSERYFNKKGKISHNFKKLVMNNHDKKGFEVYQKITAHSDGCHHSEFLHDGITVSDLSLHVQDMSLEGFIEMDTLTWSIEYYSSKNDTYSFSHNEETNTTILRTSKPFNELTTNAIPIDKPLFDFITKKLDK